MSNKFKTFCIIGDPIEHSLSPAMQNAAFKACGLDFSYIAFRVRPGELQESLESLKASGISGFNVTIPHKVEIMKYLQILDDTSKKAGAVNTVSKEGEKLKGHNTDIYGFITPIEKREIDLSQFRVLVLGAGGAARAIISALSDHSEIGEIVVANRDLVRRKQLSHLARGLGINNLRTVDISEIRKISPQSDLIINATSVGLRGEPCILEAEFIRQNSIVYDIVYRPVATPLIEQARLAKARVIYGYEMLIEQGARSFEIWTGKRAPVEAMKKALLGVFGEPG